jgi:three-Cys-motif partner protein
VRNCKVKNCKDENGNCLVPGLDGLPVQCVGPWVEVKYYFLEQYLNATKEIRRKFFNRNNAVFIDLFSGPGKCIVKHDKREIESGGMRALNLTDVPFNEYFYFDILKVNTDTLEKRINIEANKHIKCGDSNNLVDDLVAQLSHHPFKRYHFAFIDPFGPDGLKFKTLRELARLDRMDMLIHFPIGAIKRNLPMWIKGSNTILDDFLGTNQWRKVIAGLSKLHLFKTLVNIFKEQLKSIGYPEEGLRLFPQNNNIRSGLPAVSVKNTKEVNLYVLILASKNPIAQKIWNSIIKIEASGQRKLF